MKSKTYYYSDERNDDFGTMGHSEKPLPKDFKYVHTNIFYRAWAFILYFGIVLPILFCYTKIVYGIKINNRKVLKDLKKKNIGVFMYGNHTHNIDAFSIHVFVSPRKRSYAVSNAAAATFSKLVGLLVMQLGCLPLPSTYENVRGFKDAMKKRVDDGNFIVIYPEAHEWPYFTGVRDFPATSFKYPVSFDKPVVFFSTTYHKRKCFNKILKPRIEITLSDVYYPNKELSVNDAAMDLRNKCYEFLKEESKRNTVEAYKYICKEKSTLN